MYFSPTRFFFLWLFLLNSKTYLGTIEAIEHLCADFVLTSLNYQILYGLSQQDWRFPPMCIVSKNMSSLHLKTLLQSFLLFHVFFFSFSRLKFKEFLLNKESLLSSFLVKTRPRQSVPNSWI